MPSCAVAGGWRRGSDGGPSPADPPVPPSVCGPAEVLGSVSSVLWKTIQHSSVLQRSVIENNIFFFFFFSPRATCNLLHHIFFCFSPNMSEGIRLFGVFFTLPAQELCFSVMRHSLCIYANRGRLGENILQPKCY